MFCLQCTHEHMKRVRGGGRGRLRAGTERRKTCFVDVAMSDAGRHSGDEHMSRSSSTSSGDALCQFFSLHRASTRRFSCFHRGEGGRWRRKHKIYGYNLAASMFRVLVCWLLPFFRSYNPGGVREENSRWFIPFRTLIFHWTSFFSVRSVAIAASERLACIL